MSLAPIVLFVYNRPVHTRQTVEALLKNELSGESDLIIFSDAPNNPDALHSVNEVREYIKSVSGFKSISIIERDKNWGLANSVIDGVTSIVNKYGRIIVLEDDLVTSPYFLDYMNAALERYENDEKVMQVSGHMFPISIAFETDAVFLPLTTSWGWATWQRAWQHFDPEAKGHESLKHNSKLRYQFNLENSFKCSEMLDKQMQGEIDSWAIRWYWSFFQRNGLTLFPCKSLVENIGLDGSGTHGAAKEFINALPQAFKVIGYPEVVVNTRIKNALYQYFEEKHVTGFLAYFIEKVRLKLKLR